MAQARLSLLTIACAACIALPIVGCGGGDEESEPAGAAQTDASKGYPDLAGEEMVFAMYGGEVDEAMKDVWTGPFSELTGAKIHHDGSLDFSKLKAQVESGNVTWDVTYVDGFIAIDECGKLYEPLDKSIVDLSQVDPRFVTNDCTVPVVQYALMYVYDKEKFGDNPPTSWADFFNTATFPGKRGIWSYPLINGAAEAALLADGVSPDQLYPLDVDRAFAKLDTIKSDIMFYESQAQAAEQLLSGSVAMSLMFNGRAYLAVKEGANYAPVWNQNLRPSDQLGVVKGSAHKDAAMHLLDYIATPEPQAKLTERTAYDPTTPDSKPELDALGRSYQTVNPKNAAKAVDLDYDWWAEHFEDFLQRWTEWASG